MHAHVRSATLFGIDALPVDVEVDLTNGLPSFTTVGLPHGAVREGRERIMAALAHFGWALPPKRVTINLAPGDIKKDGTGFDLPIAVCLLAAGGQVPHAALDDVLLIGELSLDGELRPVRGALSVALAARRLGVRALVLPLANAAEAALVAGLEVFGARTLAATCAHLAGTAELAVQPHESFAAAAAADLDLADVRSQSAAKRALEVAAAGAHNILLIGPPGAGKTMLARRLPTILPPFALDEALETTSIHSVAGLLPADRAVIAARPFRAPHHTISDAGLIGGGTTPRPGEVSLAHGGVLFLDELPEFRSHVLEALRQPLEDGYVTVSRAITSLTYPARVLLVGAMNPCPCGYAGEPGGRCACTPSVVERYRSRLSGPLLDRIDLHLRVPPVPIADLAGPPTEPSERIRERVNAARARQRARFAERPGVYANAHMAARDIRRWCVATPEAETLLRAAIARLGLSVRAYHRVLKVARTIADLAGKRDIGIMEVAEAVQYRVLDRETGIAVPVERPAEVRSAVAQVE